MPNIRWLIALVTRIHRWVFVKTGGMLGSRLLHMRFLMITHVGRRSGLERKTPLLCVEEEGGWVVVASNGGDDRDPAWWLNLQLRPEARVQFGREDVAVVARRATQAEYEAMWEKLQSSYPYYDNYRKRTSREIAVVVLERSDEDIRSPAAAAAG